MARSEAVPDGALEVERFSSVRDALAHDYVRYLPGRIRLGGGQTFRPLGGSGTPAPMRDLPLDGSTTHAVSVHGLLDATTARPNETWIDVELDLGERLRVGGILYAGLPFLPYALRENGESSSNFGLPREIAVSWRLSDRGFLDDDGAVVQQEPTSHSGVHVLPIGGVETSRLVVRLADFPTIITRIGARRTEKLGVVMPMLCVYEHRESTRYRPRVPAGLLASFVERGSAGAEKASDGFPIGEVGARAPADLVFYAAAPQGTYFSCSAASALDAGRTLSIPERPDVAPFIEQFVSVRVQPGDRVVLVVEQAEEHLRCLAGATLAFRCPTLRGIASLGTVTVRIDALDPPENVPPLATMEPATARRFETRLFDGTVRLGPSGVGRASCRFLRPTASRYLRVAIENAGTKPGHLGLTELALVQSAHTVVVPRPTRRQHIAAVRLRLIAAGLADDHARIGAGGLSIHVERLVAGERKEILFSASSLVELLAAGAQLFANARYLETTLDVTNERVDTVGGRERHRSNADSLGWRRTESGDGVAWPRREHGPLGGYGFQTFGNSESRTQNEALPHEGFEVPYDEVRSALELLRDDTSEVTRRVPDHWLPPFPPNVAVRLERTEPGDLEALPWTTVWRGMQGVGPIGLMTTLSLPPLFGLPDEARAQLREMVVQLRAFVREWRFPAGPDLLSLAGLASIVPTGPFGIIAAHLLNGLGFGISGGGGNAFVSGSGSLSMGPWLPSVTHTMTKGRSGAITKQAYGTGYSYAQSLQSGFDANEVEVEIGEGSVGRIVSRRPNFDATQRRRTRGVEVHWQGKPADIVVATIPVGITLPATADRVYRTTDESIRVRLEGADDAGVAVAVTFDLEEELVRDDP